MTRFQRGAFQRGHSAENGLSKWTVLFFGALTAAIVTAAYQIIPFYYYYYELLNQMSALARVASAHTDQEIRTKLNYHIKRMEIPLAIDEIEIARGVDRIQISAEYKEVFYLTFRDKEYDIHTFHFRAYVDEKYSGEL